MNYQDKKFPGRRLEGDKLVFFWQSAFIDAIDYPYVLYGDVWEGLSNYDRRCGSSLYKEYASADAAVRDMLAAWQRTGRDPKTGLRPKDLPT